MKKLFILLSVALLILSSCNKSDENTEIDLPQWLKAVIEQDEQYISQNPKLMPAWGVWERTEYKSEIYFEYSNIVSSLMNHPIISYAQDTLSWDDYNDYLKNKCCSKVVWHGNGIDEEFLNVFYGDE